MIEEDLSGFSKEELDQMIRAEEKKLRRGDRKRLKGAMNKPKFFGIDQCLATQLMMGSVVLVWIMYVMYLTMKMGAERGI